MDRKQIRKAFRKVVESFAEEDPNPPAEFFDLIEQALVDLNRIADATENLERKTGP